MIQKRRQWPLRFSMSSESHSLSRTQSGFQLQHLLWARYISCSRHAEEGWPSAAWSSGRAGGCGSSNVRDEHCVLWCWQMQRCAAHGGSSCLSGRGKVSEPVLGAVSAGWWRSWSQEGNTEVQVDVRGQAALGESWAVCFGWSAMLDDDVFKGYWHSQRHWPHFPLWFMKILYRGFRKVKQTPKRHLASFSLSADGQEGKMQTRCVDGYRHIRELLNSPLLREWTSSVTNLSWS